MNELPRIRKFSDPVLWAPVRLVDVKDKETLRIAAELRWVLKKIKNGVGLAAPQLGYSKAIIVVWNNRAGWPLTLFNPALVWQGEGQDLKEEACLSFPGSQVALWRWLEIGVRFTPPDGREIPERRFTGMEARIVQHEIDHLRGICKVGEAYRPQ